MSRRGPPNLTEAQWTALLVVAHPLVPRDAARARHAVDQVRSDFLGLTIISPARIQTAMKIQRKVITCATALGRALHEDRRSQSIREVARIRLRARRRSQTYSFMAALRNGNRKPEREYLLIRLVEDVWKEEFGGTPTVTMGLDDGKAGGPLIRFVMEAVGGLGLEPPMTADIARRFIQKYRRKTSMFHLRAKPPRK